VKATVRRRLRLSPCVRFRHATPSGLLIVDGTTKSLITTRFGWASGMEMTVVGALEAAITCGLGRAFGGL
jgi:hypothetical protein